MTRKKASFYDIDWEKRVINVLLGEKHIESISISKAVQKTKQYDFGSDTNKYPYIPILERLTEEGWIERYIEVFYDFDEGYEQMTGDAKG